MLIKVFDSEWFEPTGIRLVISGYEDTAIIFGNSWGGHPHPDTPLQYSDYILIRGKTPDEVASEINQQLNKDK